jgi:hypothetical protein
MDPSVVAGSRRSIRRAIRLSVEVVSERCEAPMRYVATDLSPVGMWMQTADPLRAGATCVVCFSPDGSWSGGELMIFAEVARVATSRRRLNEPGMGMGVEFTDLEDDQRAMLAAWLATRRAPIPRRRRPLRRFAVPEPEMQRSFDEVLGTTALASVVVAPPAPLLEPHRPLGACWR